MAKAVSLTFEAQMGKAVDSMSALAKRIGALEKSTQKLTAATAKTVRKMEEVGTAGNRAADGGGKFSRVLDTMSSRLGALVGVGGGLMLFRSMLTKIQEEGGRAAESILTAHDAAARLVQVTTSRPELKRELLQSELTAIEAGMPVSRARDISFAARSFGLGVEDVTAIAGTQRFTAAGGAERFAVKGAKEIFKQIILKLVVIFRELV